MKSQITLLCALFFMIGSCNNGSETKETTDDTTQKMNEAEGEAPPAVSMAHSELNGVDTMTRDFITMTYGRYLDTLYGYRVGDTLTVEGDIKYVYTDGAKGAGTTHRLWTPLKGGKVTIPYTVDPNYARPADIAAAIRLWEAKGMVDFVERTNETDYIYFVPGSSTRSYIGRVGGGQTIELADWARTGNIAHEMGHCMGIYHEQSRSDRDQYVTINCPNDINYKHAYKKDPYARDIGPYNYYSIMHYPANSCMSVIQSTPAGIPGQRDSITVTDHATIKEIYKLR